MIVYFQKKKKEKETINENLGSWRIGQTFVSRQHSMRGKKQHSIAPLAIRGFVKLAQKPPNTFNYTSLSISSQSCTFSKI